jgi:hypothetical protein
MSRRTSVWRGVRSDMGVWLSIRTDTVIISRLPAAASEHHRNHHRAAPAQARRDGHASVFAYPNSSKTRDRVPCAQHHGCRPCTRHRGKACDARLERARRICPTPSMHEAPLARTLSPTTDSRQHPGCKCHANLVPCALRGRPGSIRQGIRGGCFAFVLSLEHRALTTKGLMS